MEIIRLTGKNSLAKATEIINNGGIIICPTDTVYGFLADASNKKAVEKIFKIKKRPRTKPLAIFVKDIKMAQELAEIDERQKKILKKHWPGKFTFILKSKIENYISTTLCSRSWIQGQRDKNQKFNKNLSKLVIAKNNTIGIRIPKYKFLNDLLKKINKPMAQTSVNISGKSELSKIKEIIAELKKNKNKPDLIIDAGNLPKIKPSVIIDLTKKEIKILRK